MILNLVKYNFSDISQFFRSKDKLKAMTNPHNRLSDLTEYKPMVTMSGFSKWRSRYGNRQLSKTRARVQNPWQTETKTGSRHMCATPPSTQNTALSCAFVVTGDFDIDERALCCLHQSQVKQVDFALFLFLSPHIYTDNS